MFLKRVSLRARLIGLFVAIFGTTLVIFSFVLYQVFINNHEREFDTALFNYAVDVAHAIDVNLFGELTLTPNVLAQSEKVFPFALGETLLQIRTISGKPVARSTSLGTANLPFTRETRDALLTQHSLFSSLSSREFTRPGTPARNYRMLVYLIEKPAGLDFVLQVAVSQVLLQQEKRGMISFFAFAIPVVLLIAAFGGMYVSRKALDPMNAIIAKARGITAWQLSERVPVPFVQDEIKELAETLNELLNRLELTFRSQESFIADASHQLKTPLAILRGEIDLMKARPRSPAEQAEFFTSASQEVGYLSRMVDDLLMLARVEAGPASLSIQRVRLDETVIEVIARLERIAGPKRVKISLNLGDATQTESPYELEGDPDLLRCLTENLVENAVKYSTSDSTVEVSIADRDEKVVFEVKDQGPGIPLAAHSKIFNRFYRSESSRDKVSGSGLGLAIVKRIVDLHQGEIRIQSDAGRGALFIVELRKMISQKQGPKPS